MSKATGACLRGSVKYAIDGPLRPVVYCHCGQRRRTSGHFVAATACNSEHLKMLVDDGLRWFDSSAEAKRGFCAVCGASMFWQAHAEEHISIMAGTLDDSTNIDAVEHIFVADAGGYYSLNDDLPKRPAGR